MSEVPGASPSRQGDTSTLPAAVLWDMDGTLVDTEPYWIAAETELVTAHGGRWTQEDGLGLVGNALPVSAEILQRAGVDMAVDAIVDALIARVVEQVSVRVPWCPGAVELLTDLRAAGVPCALVTMSYRPLTVPLLAQAPAGAISAVVTGEEVTRGKPHPEPYLAAADLLGVDIRRCVAFEDSIPGVASALASGARTIAVEQHVAVAAQPELSRVSALTQVDLSALAYVANGGVLDLID